MSPSLTSPIPATDTNKGAAAGRLAANLAALAIHSPSAAALIRRAEPVPADRLEFRETQDAGSPSALLDGKALASRQRPIDEADRLAATVDLKESGVVVVMGFGLGHHIAALAQRMKRDGVIIVFEPDMALMRSVFERIDHSRWLANANLALLTDPDDRAAMSAAMKGSEGVLALGVRILEHPPSRPRLGDGAKRFGDALTATVAAVRTVVVTTMVQTEATVRNLLMNADHYCRTAAGGGVAELRGLCTGRPAIVVSAGPSLERNVRLLNTPGLRDRCVIIAVQTALKRLLALGIRPHFVTALDHHEISRRFYEGLTEHDCAGVTLVAEAKANPAILDGFPGALRCAGDDWLDAALGPELAGSHGSIPPGATVAHLAYYLARHLGCDPVALVGQDLGFTDGQYYAAGAAIHDVWAGELNEFNTLETMEWQRIVRGRRTLRRATDHVGRSVYTDEQMATYLAQFERDFKADAERGLTVLDATEGGVAKAHTTTSLLRDAIAQFMASDAPPIPTPPGPPRQFEDRRRADLASRLRRLRADVGMVGELSRRARSLLNRMSERQDDQALVNTLISDVNALRNRVIALEPAYGLVQKLNQTGGFNRARADRRLRKEEGLTALETQRRQIERDRTNVEWLADAADSLAGMLDDAVSAVEAGAPKRTRDPVGRNNGARAPGGLPAGRALRAGAVIAFEPVRCGHDADTLRAVIRRLERCREIEAVIILAQDVEQAGAIAAGSRVALRVEMAHTEQPPLGSRLSAIRAARLWSDGCWRGGLCGMTVYDEALAPAPTALALERRGLDAALVVGADWALVDPALCDACIARWRERPDKHRLTFTQAPPGLAGCVIDRSLLLELAASHERGGPFATIGGLLGYVPVNPMADPIAHAVCVQIAPAARDAMAPCIPDSPTARALLAPLLKMAHGDADAAAVGDAAWRRLLEWTPPGPKETTLELCIERTAPGLRGRLLRPCDRPPVRGPITRDIADRLFAGLAEARPDALITFGGLGDPLLHPQCGDLAAIAKRRGVAGVHVRTDLLAPRAMIDSMLDAPVDVVSVDVLANSAATYERLAGVDAYRTLLENLEYVLKHRSVVDGLPRPWVVARITRCDAVYEEIEAFYDKWLLVAGAAVIDPLPWPRDCDRIAPLEPPARVKVRDALRRMLVHSTGAVVVDERDLVGAGVVGDVARESVADVWRRVVETRRQARLSNSDGTAPAPSGR